MKQTQINWTKEQLKTHGKVSRNQALQNFISRLGAIILNIKKEGWEIEGKNVKENGGTNYYYYLKSKPKIRKFVLIDGRATEIYE